ncbi:MAG: SulP family inorganic anion transporter, partial [Synechococcaceae cyanobacterium]|nr:SulP family inorganic anion transporter [Synechococcaceae cyanobacterium]
MRGIRPLRAGGLQADVVAGITLAALAIPEVMGYTRISQTPVVTGLYTMLLPMVAFALLGSSRHLVVAADSATAAILAATLLGLAAPQSPDYVGLTMAVALVVGLFLLLAAVLRLGFLADFLSRSALIGLLSGIGIQVAAGELGGLLGLAKEGSGALQQIGSVLIRLGQAHPAHLLCALIVFGVIVGCRWWNPRIPGALIAVVGSIAASWLFDLQAHGLPVVGTVPGGLPQFSLPRLDPTQWNQVLLTAASCFVVILAQSAATSRAYAQRYDERCDENVDLIGLACANVAAGLSGTFVVNGSPTKTEMVDAAGGRSQ